MTRIHEGPTGEKMYRVRIKSIPKGITTGVVDKVMPSTQDEFYSKLEQ